jgi:ketosteroid isomerase-like protein
MPASAPVQSATLDKFLTSWKEKDIDGTIGLWSDDFTQQILPSSLGVPTKSRGQAAMVYPNLMGSLTNWDVSADFM